MNRVGPRTLAALLCGKGDNEMVYVGAQDALGYRFEGRVLEQDDKHYDIEATDGEVVYNLRVDRIEWAEVRPFQRFVGYSSAHFVSEFGPGVSG